MAHDRSRSIVLMGMMGAGKSTAGKALATRLGRNFVDTDTEIERRTGMTVSEIFETHGEKAFRELEVTVVKEAVQASEPTVASIGGGAVLDPRTRAVLKQGATVVWLDATIESLISRATQRPGARPLLRVNPEQTMRKLAAEREPIYESLANLRIDVTRVNARDVAARIAESLS